MSIRCTKLFDALNCVYECELPLIWLRFAELSTVVGPLSSWLLLSIPWARMSLTEVTLIDLVRFWSAKPFHHSAI